MIGLVDKLRELDTLEARKLVLLARKRALERQARQGSPMVTGQARRLMTDALLGLLARHGPIDASGLRAEILASAGARDRFALELCNDWLDDAGEAQPETQVKA